MVLSRCTKQFIVWFVYNVRITFKKKKRKQPISKVRHLLDITFLSLQDVKINKRRTRTYGYKQKDIHLYWKIKIWIFPENMKIVFDFQEENNVFQNIQVKKVIANPRKRKYVKKKKQTLYSYTFTNQTFLYKKSFLCLTFKGKKSLFWVQKLPPHL